MKTLYEQLAQVFNALEFANTGHLTDLTTKLDSCGAQSSEVKRSVNRINNAFNHITSETVFTR